jgi:hypothetical protein
MRRSGKPPRYSAPSIRRPQAAVPGFIATSLVKPRAAMNAADAVRQMAEDMRNAAYREGGINADDLETLGFTPEQIKAHGRAAARKAHALAAMT